MNRNVSGLKTLSITCAAIVYAGAVIYGDIMFLTVMQSAFPSGVMGALAMAGALMTAASALTLPIALHWWFAPGIQYIWGIMFWFFDILILALNSMLAYSQAIGNADQWLATWQMISPITPLFAVLGWGIAFLSDPSHKLRHAQIELEADLIDIQADQLREAAKAQRVFKLIDEGANAQALSIASNLSQIHVNPNNRKPQPIPQPDLIMSDPTLGQPGNGRAAP